jgi:hypothetical protein
MRPGGVVVLDEAVDLALELLLCDHALLDGQELLERLVEALDLAAGLGVIGPRLLGADAEAEQLLLEGTSGARSALSGEDEPVVREERRRIAPFLGSGQPGAQRQPCLTVNLPVDIYHSVI